MILRMLFIAEGSEEELRRWTKEVRLMAQAEREQPERTSDWLALVVQETHLKVPSSYSEDCKCVSCAGFRDNRRKFLSP